MINCLCISYLSALETSDKDYTYHLSLSTCGPAEPNLVVLTHVNPLECSLSTLSKDLWRLDLESS